MTETVLVTGGCGFIGANLVPHLANAGFDVRVFDNLSRGKREYIPASVNYEFYQGDLRDSSALAEAFAGVDRIVHLAAYGSVVESVVDPIENFEINARGTLNVLKAAHEAGVKKLVFSSTGGALIGDATPPVNENSVARPKSAYGASKLTGEAYCYAFGQTHEFPVTVLRFANIYGPISAHKKGAITVFSKAIIKGDPITIFGDGSASRDFLHVDDLCSGILAALTSDLPPATVLHVATGRETTMKELVSVLLEAAGAPDHPIEYQAPRAGEVHRNFATYDLAASLLGFEPKVGLEAGMKRTWEWFQAQGKEILDVETTDS